MNLAGQKTPNKKEVTRNQEAWALGEKGLCRCNVCQKVTPLETSIVTYKGPQFLFCMCGDCIHAGYGAVFQRTVKGFQIRFAKPTGAIIL